MAKKISQKRLKRIKTVFGDDVKFDENNRPIEQGIGAPGHETLSHFMALAKSTQITAKLSPTPENIAEAQRCVELLKQKQKELPPDEVEEDEEEDEEF